jgi:hypothetical protein
VFALTCFYRRRSYFYSREDRPLRW